MYPNPYTPAGDKGGIRVFGAQTVIPQATACITDCVCKNYATGQCREYQSFSDIQSYESIPVFSLTIKGY